MKTTANAHMEGWSPYRRFPCATIVWKNRLVPDINEKDLVDGELGSHAHGLCRLKLNATFGNQVVALGKVTSPSFDMSGCRVDQFCQHSRPSLS
jgi:hypothetical protein